MPFTEDTFSFLMENRLMDSREWFHEHKYEYNTYVVEPMAQLFQELTPGMLALDPEFICIPQVGKSISRLWRDTRAPNNPSIFREYIWMNFIREKYRGLPGYWFAVSPAGCEWGCGWYATGTATMKALREKVLADDPLWLEADRAYDSQTALTITGEKYKKSPFTAQPERKRRWLEQRSISLETPTFGDALFEEGLADRVLRDFEAVAPVYRFFLENAVRWEW